MPRTVLELEKKRVDLRGYEWKVVDAAQGIIKGYLAVFNNVDSYNDRIRPGAFKKTIADALQRKTNRGKRFLWPLLWMHDPEQPIGGFIDAVEDKTGLLVTAQLDITTNEQGIPRNPQAYSVFSGFDMGYIDELSIGYKAIQKNYDQAGIRDLTEIQNFEGSAVTMLFAANELAQVSDVKTGHISNMQQKDFNDYYRQRAIADWANSFYSMTQALKSAVMDAFNIGDQPEQDVTEALTGANGFIAAMADWVQEGIDLDVSGYMKQPDVDTLANPMLYMSASGGLDIKAGRAISQSNSDMIMEHVKTLQNMADISHKTINTVADDLSNIIGRSAYTPEAEKTAVRPSQTPNTRTEDKAQEQPSNDTDPEEQLKYWLASEINNK